MLLLAITGCAPGVGETTGPFTRLHPDLEMQIGRNFLDKVYHMSEEVGPLVWLGSAADIEPLCGAEAGACLVGNDILILDDPGVDRCVGVEHELGHYMEWLRGPMDYDHAGVLADWYNRQVYLLCEALK